MGAQIERMYGPPTQLKFAAMGSGAADIGILEFVGPDSAIIRGGEIVLVLADEVVDLVLEQPHIHFEPGRTPKSHIGNLARQNTFGRKAVRRHRHHIGHSTGLQHINLVALLLEERGRTIGTRNPQANDVPGRQGEIGCDTRRNIDARKVMVFQHGSSLQQYPFMRAPLQIAEHARKLATPLLAGIVILRAGDSFLAYFTSPYPAQIGAPLLVYLQLDITARLQQILVDIHRADTQSGQIRLRVGIETVLGIVDLQPPLAARGFHFVIGQLQIHRPCVLLLGLQDSSRTDDAPTGVPVALG